MSTTNSDVQRILSFWYDRSPVEWFRPPQGFDGECKSKFADLVVQAKANRLDDWAEEPESSVALLILLDQFTRNIFRGTPDAFGSDAKAAAIATEAVAKGFDKQVGIYKAIQFYLPLMHQESLLAQVACLSLLENLQTRAQNDAEESDFLKKSIGASRMHLQLISRFGRYPSRNSILGRENTEDESRFLEENPSGFPAMNSSS